VTRRHPPREARSPSCAICCRADNDGRNHDGQALQRQDRSHIRNSIPDWDAFLAERAPEGAPNVLVGLYDDTGCAAWSPYGGRIEMPTLHRLADDVYVDVERHLAAAMMRD
jgi:hypothetical protein